MSETVTTGWCIPIRSRPILHLTFLEQLDGIARQAGKPRYHGGTETAGLTADDRLRECLSQQTMTHSGEHLSIRSILNTRPL